MSTLLEPLNKHNRHEFLNRKQLLSDIITVRLISSTRACQCQTWHVGTFETSREWREIKIDNWYVGHPSMGGQWHNHAIQQVEMCSANAADELCESVHSAVDIYHFVFVPQK